MKRISADDPSDLPDAFRALLEDDDLLSAIFFFEKDLHHAPARHARRKTDVVRLNRKLPPAPVDENKEEIAEEAEEARTGTAG